MGRERDVWRLELGATVLAEGVRFRVWAPKSRQVEVVIEGGPPSRFPLSSEKEGYFSGVVPQLKAGALYRYRLDHDRQYPDPCSRFQPQGPHGPSLVVDPCAYHWQDAAWRGVRLHGQVLYELHIGAFTREGTFDAAAAELAELQRLGITLIEVIPVAEFPGRWNWGYDGAALYRPTPGSAGDFADFRALRQGRTFAEPLSRRRTGRSLQYRRRHLLVLPCA